MGSISASVIKTFDAVIQAIRRARMLRPLVAA
jgi:hypothetical protein